MISSTRKLSDRHEAYLADLFGGRVTLGSGNQWRDQTDVKQPHGSAHYLLAMDGKATLGKSIGVSREMWRKLVEQAGHFIPALPLRFYANEALTRVEVDLVAVEAHVFAEILEDANAYRASLDAQTNHQGD